jgi:hypothetical protein
LAAKLGVYHFSRFREAREDSSAGKPLASQISFFSNSLFYVDFICD